MSRRKLQINKKHTKYEKTKLEEAYQTCPDPDLKIKLLALLQFWDGKTSVEVSENLHKSDSTVREWLHAFNQHGFEGLNPKPRQHKGGWLSPEQLDIVKEVLQKSPRECGFNRSNWSMSLLSIWISKNLGINYKPGSLYRIVHGLGFTMQRPKKQSKNFDPQLKEQFRKDIKELIHSSDEDTVILYQDEAIITSEPTIMSSWALKGQQPVISTDSKGSRHRKVIFGAVNPKIGKVHYTTEDKANADTFKSFLK